MSGHGRGAAYGAVVADLLAAVGFDVHREYYVNDAGRQMDILATSVWLRYLELCGEELDFPSNGYKGDYVWDIAATLHREHGDGYRVDAAAVFAGVPPDERPGEGDGDKEAHIDGLIAAAKRLLGDNRYRYCFELGLNTILDDIRDDLGLFGVHYQEWYSERSLAESGAVNKAIERLRRGRPGLREGRGPVVPQQRLRRREGPGAGARERPDHLFRLRHRLPPGQAGAGLRAGDRRLGGGSPRLCPPGQGGPGGPGGRPVPAGRAPGAVRHPLPGRGAGPDVHPLRASS